MLGERFGILCEPLCHACIPIDVVYTAFIPNKKTHTLNPTQERVARDQLEKLGPIHRSARDSNASVAATGSRALDAQPIGA